MHTLSAIILEENSRVLAIGLTGGHYRPLLHAQPVTNIVDYEMKIQEAIKYPRFLWKPGTKVVEYEEGLDASGLKDYRVVRRPYPSRMGIAAVVELVDRVRAGYTDIRGDELPIGLP